jgi:CheY-like chemotaxis protein
MEAVARPRVLLADDHEAVLAWTSAILRDFDLVGVVHKGRDAIAEVQRLDQMCWLLISQCRFLMDFKQHPNCNPFVAGRRSYS